MANQDAAFGLRAIGKVGQNRDNQGLSEYSIASGTTAAIYQNDPVQALATGYIGVQNTTTGLILGSLNGVFYTDPTTSKPTFGNYWPGDINATDAVAFVSDDPYERFEIQASTTLPIASINALADLATYVSSDSRISKVSSVELNTSAVSTTTDQFKILGVTKDLANNELANATTYAANVNVVGVINNHFLKNTTGI